MNVRRSCVVLVSLFALNSCGSMGSLGGLGTDTIVAGLKEALGVGTNNAVSITSAAGGFSNNPGRFIGLPGALSDIGKALQAVGQGQLITDLERGMNLAAEQASSQAGPVFLDAIRQMTFSDARNILQGSNTAATDYFNQKTRPGLRQVYEPIVRDQMNRIGVVKQYNDLLGTYTRLPFTSKPDLSIEGYVTNKALDGLFSVLADEERKIRTDPLARVTPLLQRVFAGQ